MMTERTEVSDYHKRRLAERVKDPEFKRAYEVASDLSPQLRDYADEKVWEKETKRARTVPDYLPTRKRPRSGRNLILPRVWIEGNRPHRFGR